MKTLIIAASVLALSTTAALADKPNNKGSGGQTVKATNQALHDAGTNLGQAKKDAGVSGKDFGAAVSGLNQASNH